MENIFWLDHPLILFNKNYITELWPWTNLSIERKINALTRVIILMTVLGFIITKKISILIIGFLTLSGIVFVYKKRQVKKINKEAFSRNLLKGKVKSDFFKLEKGNYTQPTKDNPLMNVLLPEIVDNPKRPPAAPSFEPPIEKAINNSTIDPRLFLDLGDNLAFDRSMRNFYSMPNTQIPADQKAFGEFCYGNMPSCKEGNEFQCAKNNSGMRPY